MTEIIKPATIDELSTTIQDHRGSLVPLGAGTQKDFGNPLRSSDAVLDLTALNRIAAYNPADLTIHAEAGVTLGELQRVVEENNQTLPIDPWNGPSATIGGLAATNSQGPLRAVGTLRNWIIGMRVVHADGRVSKTGGRVVKNVTGYDLAKIYTGSLGSLAIITEISLKLRPKFPKTATALANFDRLADALTVLKSIRNSALQPIACELVGPPTSLWIRFGEHPSAVDWQVSNLPKADWTVTTGAEEHATWEVLRDRYRQHGPIVLRVVAAPADLGEVMEFVKPAAWIAHALNGIVLAVVPDPEEILRIRQRFSTVIEKAPLHVRSRIPCFGIKGAELALMNDFKRGFDPDGRLNPGRYVDGE